MSCGLRERMQAVLIGRGRQDGQALRCSNCLLPFAQSNRSPTHLFHQGLGTGVIEFFRKTQAEMVGDADSRGEGLRRLAKAVIGGPFSSLSKMTGSIAGLIEEMTGLRPGESDLDEAHYLGQSVGAAAARRGGGGGGGSGADSGDSAAAVASRAGRAGVGWSGGQQQRPQHLGEGLRKGGEHFYRVMKTGAKNIYDLPASGATRDGFPGFLKGVGKGFVGALAAPVVATLGGISRVTDTVCVRVYVCLRDLIRMCVCSVGGCWGYVGM